MRFPRIALAVLVSVLWSASLAAGTWHVSEPTDDLPGARAEQTIYDSLPPGSFRSKITNEGPAGVRVRVFLQGDGLVTFPLNPASSVDVSMNGVWKVEIKLVHDPSDGVHEEAQGSF